MNRWIPRSGAVPFCRQSRRLRSSLCACRPRLPLDDVFVALKDVIPHLTRSSLHRCLQRHGISRLPKADREKPKRLKTYEIGYFHIDIAELRYEGGKAWHDRARLGSGGLQQERAFCQGYN